MTNSKARKNPYIIGRPIHEKENFIGREDLFHFIQDNFNANTKFLLLHGQRRIGKSSVLQQFVHRVSQQEFFFVFFDLQGYNNSSLNKILYKLAEAITEAIAEDLGIDSDIITLPNNEELRKNQDIFYSFLSQVFQELGDKNLVLLLDEFDVVHSDSDVLNQGNCFFRYLQSLLRQSTRLFIIPVVGRCKDDFQNLSQLFNSPPYQEIGLLNDLSAKRLITKPAQGMLEYEEDAIQAILKLSAGHPYFTQAICFNLFEKAKMNDDWIVTRSDVQGIVDKAIESVSSGLAWFWDGLSISEQVVFSAASEAKKIAIEQNKSFPEDPLTLLKQYGVIPTQLLTQAARQLAEKGYLDDTERRVKVELVRCWLVQCHPLQQEIFKLEKIEIEENNNILSREIELHRHGNPQDVIDHYEEILQLNPNHFSILPVLAKKYLEIENFDKALELYMRAYQVNPICNKEGLLLAREAYGKKLIEQRELIKAKVQFEAVLEIEPDRESANQELIKIETKFLEKQSTSVIADKDLTRLDRSNSRSPVQRFTLGTIAAVIALVSGGYAISQLILPCSGDQQKVNGKCVPSGEDSSLPTINKLKDKISRGERTLFSDISNSLRDQGIEAFKKGNYPEARRLFEEAVKSNPNDPEILIYSNNAKAREKGNPLTLAVVVPADNSPDKAQEILRGVAQAQNDFNPNALNNRLLEIIIANDGNNPDQARQIAQQLVDDKSILGVIGHNDSDATREALNVYRQEKIPIISPTSTANTLNGNNFFRTVPSDIIYGQTLAAYAKNKLLNTVVIFYNPGRSYSNNLRVEFEKEFKGKLFPKIDLTDKTLNIEQKLKDIASQQVQAVMLFPDVENTSVALGIVKANQNMNLGLKFLGGDSLYSLEILKNGGDAMEGLVLAVPWFREAIQSKNFATNLEKNWKGGISWRTATSFDATKAFIKSIKSLSSNPSRETILQELPNVKLTSKDTSGDELQFINGERQSKPILVKVEKGKFKCLQEKECSL